MFPVKSSLAPEGPAIGFYLNRKTGLTWLGQKDIDTSQLQVNETFESKKSLAARIIVEILNEQDTYSADILKKLKSMGISERTIQTVKKELGITSYRKNGVWLWHLHDGADSSSWEIKNA